MKGPSIPLLGYALMGLIHQKPSSGYDLRKTFAETAMGNYSSSPGAIYPALERLESRRLTRGEVDDCAGLRRRKLYRLTARGAAELKRWLARPIVQTDVMRGAEELMLRFAFMEQVLGPSACVDFLNNFSAALEPHIVSLEAFLAAQADSMPLSGQLALESGIRGYRSLRDWTGYACDVYRQSQSKSSTRTTMTSKGGLR